MKNILAITAAALVACNTASHAQNTPTVLEQSAPVAGTASGADGLSELNAMTFSCVRAGLNAAAREAAKVHAKGDYQFAYFKIINSSHHSSYEVDFESNHEGEPDLKYCVAVYCQQGWDPKTTEPSVSLIGDASQSDASQSVGMAAHGADCSGKPVPVTR